MGRKPTPAEETQALIDATRAAHEVLGDLNRAIRQARDLEPALVARFEDAANREIRDMSNQLQAILNQEHRDLNDSVANARRMIIEQLMVSELDLDESTGTITVRYKSPLFDDQVPPPYPDQTPRETKP